MASKVGKVGKNKRPQPYLSDPGSGCMCKTLCTSRKTKLGVCPCVQKGAFCSRLCGCGTGKKGKTPCRNHPGHGIVSQDQGLDDVTENDEVLEVSFHDIDLPISIIFANNMELNRSIQEIVETATQVISTNSEEASMSAVTVCASVTPVTDSPTVKVGQTIDEMPRAVLLKFAKKALHLHPELEVVLKQAAGTSAPDPQPSGSSGTPSWCHCGRCRQMPTPEEQLCCRSKDGPCILETSGDTIQMVCLNREVLRVAVHDRNDLFAMHDNPDDNRTLRHTGYRQFVLWIFGRLGSGNRVLIPSCVVCKIRELYPSTDGTYKGFIRIRRLP